MYIDINSEAEQVREYVADLRKFFHMYPEMGMEEFATSKKIKDELTKMGISYHPAAGTGVIGSIGRGKKVIALRADMDGLKIQEKNEVSYKSRNQGRMHACGHDVHMASLLGAARILKKHEKDLLCTVRLLFQPSEENCLGAVRMVEAGGLDQVDEIFGLHVFGDIPCGLISIQEGPRMAVSDNFIIRITGRPGHAGKPHLCRDATLAGAALVLNLQSVISRETDPVHAAVLTVGRFESGTQRNIISGEAVLEGTVRTFLREDGNLIESSVRRISEHTAMLYNCSCEIKYLCSAHPAVINDPGTTRKALMAAEKVFRPEQLTTIKEMMLGEDFSIYQQYVKGTFAFVGGGNAASGKAYPNHHERFDVDEEAVWNAVRLYTAYAAEA